MAYVAPEPGAVPGACYATYDPIKGWQNRTWLQDDGFTNWQLTFYQGWRSAASPRSYIQPHVIGEVLEADIYDAALDRWDTHIVFVGQHPF